MDRPVRPCADLSSAGSNILAKHRDELGINVSGCGGHVVDRDGTATLELVYLPNINELRTNSPLFVMNWQLPALRGAQPAIHVDGGLLAAPSQAAQALGRLDGTAGMPPNSDLFVAMYVRQ